MKRLGIHSFVWTDGLTQAGLESAVEQSAALGYRLIELSYLRPERFDLDAIAKRAAGLDMAVVVTMGLPASADVSSEDPAVVKAGEALLASAVQATRDVGGTRLGGILYSAHGKYAAKPGERGRRNSVAAIARAAELGKAAGVEIVLELVNRFESNLLNTTAQGLAFIEATGRDDVKLHLDTFHMNIEEASPAAAIRLAGDRLGYFHVGESNRGYLGDGVIDFAPIFDALLDIGYEGDVTFESFSGAVVDDALTVAAAIWRDTWTDSRPLAAHARAFIELRLDEARRRRVTNARP
jgi:D-psicose/D-tagatose/L-ribulose 3-epimerase